MSGARPPPRPSMVARANSLPSRPSSSSSQRASSSTRPRRTGARPVLGRASTSLSSSARLHPYSSCSLVESDESDADEREGRNQFCRRYLSRRNSFESDEEDYRVVQDESLLGRWGRAYLPFSSRPSSRSSSVSTSTWHRPPSAPAPASSSSRRAPSSHARSLSTTSTPWFSHLGKTPATLGLITPALDILSWPLSHPHPHPSSHPHRPRRSQSHHSHPRVHRTSLLLQRPIKSAAATLAPPATSAPYPSPAGSDTTIRPNHYHYNACSPPPFRRPNLPSRAQSHASSVSSEEDDYLPSLPPTSYEGYLQAGRPSPSPERTPRAAKGWRTEQVSPTRVRRDRGSVPSLSYTASSGRSSLSASPTDVFSVRGGVSGAERKQKRRVED